MGSKWTFAFSKVLFLTQITRFEKKTLTSSRKKNFWSFSCFFVKFHWYLIWRLQLWILDKFFWFIQEKSKDFCRYESIYIGKIKGFLAKCEVHQIFLYLRLASTTSTMIPMIAFRKCCKCQWLQWLPTQGKIFLWKLVDLYMKSLSVSININRIVWEKDKDFAKVSQFTLEI